MQRNREKFLLFRVRVFKDESAFRTLIDEFGPSVHRFLSFKLPTVEDADDAYSTACLRMWDYISRSEVNHFSALMFTMARGVVAEHYREKAKKPTVSIEDDNSAMEVESKETPQKLEGRVDAQMMRKAIDQLPDDAREAVVLKYLEGFSTKEVANHIGKTENATSVLLHRSLKKVRKILEGKTS